MKGFAQEQLKINLSTEAQLKIDSLKKVIANVEKACPEPCIADTGRINAYLSLGEQIYMQNPDSAVALWQLSKLISEKLLAINPPIQIVNSAKQYLSSALNNIGYIYDSQGNIPKALEYFHKSLNIREKIGNKNGMAHSLCNIAKINQKQNNRRQFEKYAIRAYKISKEFGYPEILKKSASLMKDLSILQGNYKKVFEYYLEEITMRDSIQKEENYKQTQKQQAKYEFEKQAVIDSIAHVKAMVIKDIEIARIGEEKKVQAAQRNILIVGMGLMFVLAIFIFYNYHQKKKANNLLAQQKQEIEEMNVELNQQNEEILTQRDEIEAQRNLALKQKDQIKNQNKSITDSIVYAKRIQSAILPPDAYINELIYENFIFYKPRDIVSGDFYWVKQVKDYIILVAADCTGHGVPGALMSMLGISYLNEIVQRREIIKANQILNELSDQIKHSLRQHGQKDQSKVWNRYSVVCH